MAWKMGMAWAGGMVGESLWLFFQPSHDPWIRIPVAIFAALIMWVVVAFMWSEPQR